MGCLCFRSWGLVHAQPAPSIEALPQVRTEAAAAAGFVKAAGFAKTQGVRCFGQRAGASEGGSAEDRAEAGSVRGVWEQVPGSVHC